MYDGNLYISVKCHNSLLLWCPGLLLGVGKLQEGGTYLGAIVAGGIQSEMTQCDHSVGYGGR